MNLHIQLLDCFTGEIHYHYSQQPKGTTHESTEGGINEQNVGYKYNGILLILYKE